MSRWSDLWRLNRPVAANAMAMPIACYGSTPAYVPVLGVEGWADIQPELNAFSQVGKFTEMRALSADLIAAWHAIPGPA